MTGNPAPGQTGRDVVPPSRTKSRGQCIFSPGLPAGSLDAAVPPVVMVPALRRQVIARLTPGSGKGWSAHDRRWLGQDRSGWHHSQGAAQRTECRRGEVRSAGFGQKGIRGNRRKLV